jgi:resuscitation-promoting factor RpfB
LRSIATWVAIWLGAIVFSQQAMAEPMLQSVANNYPSNNPNLYIGAISYERVKPHPDRSRSYAQEEATKYGWGASQFECLNKLWERESNWRHTADNPKSSAYGIPQALPGSKMASEGSDWETNPKTQIRWGLRYIESRYSNPCNAWQHFTKKNWY